jgi:small subunit ribosomal protein S2
MAEDSKTVAEIVEPQIPVNPAEVALYEEMAKAGVLFGRRRSKTNPKMKNYIHTTRAGFDVVDLGQTVAGIEKAQQFLKELVKKGQTLLVAATTPAGQITATKFADKYDLPRVTDRWLGGTLSNFEVISKRISHLITRKADKAAGRLDKYTKKERVVIDKEIERLTKLFGGLEKMNVLPGALLVIGAPSHMTAVREAKRVKMPVIAIANTDTDPDLIDYLIPANDASVNSIEYILAKLDEAVQQGMKEKSLATAAVVKK